MKAAVRITFLDDNNEKFFGEGPCRLLKAVERTGSLRAAAMSMDMAYSKALRLMKNAETALGFALITRSTGGKDGGGSTLTDEGKQWLAKYDAYRTDCLNESQRLFRKYFPKTGCVIMASGLGRRFGGNKLMADFHGKPMILRAVDATDDLFDHRVVVTRHENVATLCKEQGIDVVLHDLPHRSDTVRLGLEALGDIDCCMFLPGDQPLLHRDTVAQLLKNWKCSQEIIFRPSYDGTPSSPVLFPRWAFSELLTLPQGKGGGTVIQAHPESLRIVPVSNQWELTDADTPEILETLKSLYFGTKS